MKQKQLSISSASRFKRVMLAAALAVVCASPAQVTHAEPDAPAISATVQPPCNTASFDAAWDLIPIGLGGTLTFNCGAAPVSINMSGTKTITKQVTIDGGGKILLNGNFITRHFVVNAGAALTLTNITIAGGGGGFYLDAGGAVQNFGTLTVLSSTFHTNQTGSNYGGGAIYSRGTLVIDNSIFRNNAAGAGGAIYTEAFFASTGKALIENSQILSNTSRSSYGGGVFNDGLLSMNNVIIQGNRETGSAPDNHGGAGLANNDTAYLSAVTISGNVITGAVSVGGAGILNRGWMSVVDATITRNQGTSSGGGLENRGTLYLDNVIFSENSASSGGGLMGERGPIVLKRVTFSNNSAIIGGGLYCESDCRLQAEMISFLGNSATGKQIPGLIAGGGGVFNLGRASFINATFSGNTANEDGGAIYASKRGGNGNTASLSLMNTTLAGNSAQSGSGLYAYIGPGSTITLTNSILANSGGNCSGTGVLNAAYSLSSDNTCSLSGPGNKINTDPMLNPLGDYGGGMLTHLPKAGSPAIDGVIGSNAPATDQRGLPRPVGAGYDIGAVERQPSDDTVTPPPPPPPPSNPIVPRIRIPIVLR
jgi:predicted outer membrane repeat protein